MKHIFQPMGIKVECRQKPFLRAVDDLNKGAVDAHAGTFATDWDGFLFPRWHFFISHIAVLFKRDPDFVWQGYASLRDKRIGWIRGYYFNLFFDEKIPIRVLELTSLEQCVNLLNAGRLDYCMDGIESGLKPMMSQMELNFKNFQMEEVFLEPAYLRFRDTPRSRKLVAIFDQRMDSLYQSGELQSLFEKWQWYQIDPKQSALAKRPRIVVEDLLNGKGEWAKLIEYINH